MVAERRRRPTLESVAGRADVSRQTVSNVIHAPHRVSEGTRRRVEAVITATGYRPSKSAQALRTRRSNLIAVGLRTPGANGEHVLDTFLHALSADAQRRGYRILLTTAADDPSEISSYEELVGDYDIDALVLTGTHLDDARIPWLLDQGTPFVTFGRPWGRYADHSWVDVDGASGVRTAVEHLVARGHRRVALFGWPEGSGVGEDRRSGWEQACRGAGLPTDGLFHRMEDSFAQGRGACAEILAGTDLPSAVVCVSDVIALGVWAELTARGLVPGHDVSVVGFDDSQAAAVTDLTSVAQPLDLAASACLDSLHSLLRAGAASPPAPQHLLLAPRLVVRRSG